MKDIRFKVSAALSEAGLQNTAYAKQLVSGLNTGAGAAQGGNIGGALY